MDNIDKKVNDELDSFLDENATNETEVVIIPKTGLVERIDKIFVTEDGRMLLREELYK